MRRNLRSALLHTGQLRAGSRLSGGIARSRNVNCCPRALSTFSRDNHKTNGQGSGIRVGLAAAFGLTVAWALYPAEESQCTRTQRVPVVEETVDELGFTYYTKKEVAKHKSKETGIWVTYKDGVYDVTDFINAHPGGDRILLAAGAAIDPFWAMYNQHLTKQVLDILVDLRIGTLHPLEEIETIDVADPYANEPSRLPNLPIRANKPYNAETILELIPDNFITPIALHYRRHHHPVPDIDPKTFELVVAHEDDNIKSVSLQELRENFTKRTIPVTLQCAGNRRRELFDIQECQGLHWDAGAVSTSEWGGVYLRDLLGYCGLGDDSALLERTGVQHVQFEGVDQPYDASIPIEKALAKFGDVLVAYEINGEPIPRDAGGPIRMIVPGHLAARSVKWVKRISVSKEESKSSWQRGFAYKGMPPNIKSFDKVDATHFPSVQELPVQSAICLPKNDSTIDVEDDEIEVKGWAWSGGGRNIVRVSSCVF